MTCEAESMLLRSVSVSVAMDAASELRNAMERSRSRVSVPLPDTVGAATHVTGASFVLSISYRKGGLPNEHTHTVRTFMIASLRESGKTGDLATPSSSTEGRAGRAFKN